MRNASKRAQASAAGEVGAERTRRDCILPSPWVAQLRPYERRLMRPAAVEREQTLRLDSNEGSDPPPFIVDRLAAFLREPGAINRYPDEHCEALVRRLSAHVGCPEQQILVFDGADGALEAISRAFLSPRDEAIVAAPSYDQFRVFVETAGARVWFVNAAQSPLHFDLPHFMQGCRAAPAPRLIYLVNPSNPAGYLIDADSILAIAGAFPHSLVVVDETYMEFVCDAQSAAGAVNEFPNLAVVRSFSKAFGLAGLRLGYVIANAAIVQLLGKVRNGKSVTSLAQFAGLLVLENLDHYRSRFAEVRSTRDWFVRGLRASGVDAHESSANFALIECDDPPGLAAALAHNGIRARDLSWISRLERFLRITIGSQDQMAVVLAAMQRIAAERRTNGHAADGESIQQVRRVQNNMHL